MPHPRSFVRSFRRVAVLAVLACLTATSRAEAVSVSPTALFIDASTRTGTITLYNSGKLPEEIEISFAFGYAVSDEQGNVSVPLTRGAAPAGEPTAAPWLRAFPRRLVLQPGQRQAVRIVAQPPVGLEEGEYWARVLVSSRGGTPPIEQVQGSARMQLALETVIANAVTFRKGEVRTGVRVRGGAAEPTAGGAALVLDMERTGNAAYIGRLRAQLVDPSGRVVSESEGAVAVYRQIRWRIVLPHGGRLGSGYTVRYALDTDRRDLPVGGPLPAPAVFGTAAVSPQL